MDCIWLIFIRLNFLFEEPQSFYLFNTKWYSFLKSLSYVGIEISDEKDQIIWSRYEKRGIPSTKLAYIYILEEEGIGVTKWWHKFVWKGTLPLKIKCFIWLSL